MSLLSAIDIRSRVLCQDIRQEKNGKLILIGVYPGDIMFANFPANNYFSFYIEADSIGVAKGNLHVRVNVNNEEAVRMEIGLQVEPGGRIVIPSPPLHLKFPEAGVLEFEMSDDEESWQTLIKRDFHQGDIQELTAISSEPPSEQSERGAPDSSSPPEPSPRPGRKKRRAQL